MEKKNFKYLLIFIFILFTLTSSYPQIDSNGQCLTSSSNDCGGLKNIPTKTPGTSDYLRCLLIYITFPDDTLSSYQYSIWKNPFETQYPRPVNPYSGSNGHLIDSLVGNPNDPFMTRYNNYTLSDFFCEMSMGTFDVIGDEIAITLPHSSVYYDTVVNFGRPELNRYILKYIDSTRNIDWSRYDNWSKINGNWVFGTSDNTAEMIIMNYRAFPNGDVWFWGSDGIGGEASLGNLSPITFGNVTIGCDNGITASNLRHATGRSEIILEHELSHKLFGGSIPKGIQNGIHINLGFMTSGHNETSYLYTPMERSAPVIGYTPINLINSTGIYTDTLPDFVESGISFKIKIPGTSDDHVWIANHQKKSLYDGIARGGSTCYSINFAEIDPYCSDGKGLFIFREGDNCSNINQTYDITSAEGKFTWDIDRTVSVPPQNYHHALGFSMPILKTLVGKRYSGKDKYNKHPAYPITNYGTWITDNECSDLNNDFNISLSFRGDSFDPFNIGYEEIFSPYSNPSSSFCDSSLTGLTIALKEQNSTTGAIIVKIYYNNDAQALIDLPPSKPNNVKVSKSFFGNPGTGTFYPKITWDQNIEPDFYNAGFNGPNQVEPKYEIYRGDSAVCDVQPVYTLIASVESDVTEFTDSSVTLLFYDSLYYIEPCYDEFLTYSYKIAAKDNRGNSSLKSERGLVSGYETCGNSEEGDSPISLQNSDTPKKYSAYNYPNPFNPVTNIKFELPNDKFVSIKIFDVLGREIKVLINEFKTTGRYIVTFDGSNLPSGIYYYKIESGNFTQVRKMILLK